MHCWIYKSSRKEEMYLYLAKENGFDDLPDPLKKGFGTPSLVMALDLQADRKLARVETAQVMSALEEQGFFLQMPPELEPEMHYGE